MKRLPRAVQFALATQDYQHGAQGLGDDWVSVLTSFPAKVFLIRGMQDR